MSSHNSIAIEDLGKRYIIGHQSAKDDGLRHVVENAVRAPFRALKAARRKKRETLEEFWALRNINLKIKQGEVVGIIGRNGAGKSTLLKILSRITEPTTGRIRVQGRVASLLEVGTGFHAELTGRENIFLNGAILGMNRAEIIRKFDEIVDFSGVEKFLDTPVKRYSSGMYVRLAFAVAAHLEPEILIVDEVLAVGDTEFQKKCLARMNEIAHSHGRTILFVSHNMAAIQNLCSRCILLHKGEVNFSGTPERTIRHYVETMTPTGLAGSSLGHRTDRSGTGSIRLTDFHIEDTTGRVVQAAMSGMDVVFVFSYEVTATDPLKKVDVGFSIASGADQLIFVLYSSYCGRYLDPLHPAGTFRCCVSNLPLAAGRYLVGARIVVDQEEADWPRDGVAFLDVEQGDFFGTGSPGFSGGLPFLVNGEWDVTAGSKEPMHAIP
jgi:lipopolysaccharide transport system ATP-binding protein